MSTLNSCFTKFLHKIDLSSISIFKVNGQNSYKTKTGGILTLMFVIIIIIIFAFRINKRNRGELMSFTKNQRYNHDQITLVPKGEDVNYFIAIHLWEQDSKNYIGENYFNTTVNGIPLQRCKKQGLQGSFCLPGIYQWNIKGSIQSLLSGGQYQSLYIQIQQCQGDLCVDPKQYQGKHFRAQVIYLNYFINPSQPNDYKQKFLSTFYINFIPNTHVSAELEVSKFIIQTDRNYLTPIPEGQTIKDEGYQILDKPFFQNYYTNYQYPGSIDIFITRSHLSTVITRTDHTLIDIFSYVGGLATLILAFIQFLAYQYNSYAFEVQFSYKLFSAHEQQKHQLKKDNKNTDDRLKQQPQNKHSMVTNILPSINLFTFLKDMLPCFKKAARMQSYRSELNKQLDIQHLLRKINVFQNMLLLLLRRSNIILSPKEINKYRIQQAQEFRKTFQLPQYENSEKTTQRQDKKTDKLQERQYKGHLEIVLESNFNLETPDQCKDTNKGIIQDNERVREEQL